MLLIVRSCYKNSLVSTLFNSNKKKPNTSISIDRRIYRLISVYICYNIILSINRKKKKRRRKNIKT